MYSSPPKKTLKGKVSKIAKNEKKKLSDDISHPLIRAGYYLNLHSKTKYPFLISRVSHKYLIKPMVAHFRELLENWISLRHKHVIARRSACWLKPTHTLFFVKLEYNWLSTSGFRQRCWLVWCTAYTTGSVGWTESLEVCPGCEAQCMPFNNQK